MISVLIPVKNGGDGLVRCLKEIAAQRVDDEVEVVVVDSGSEDGSPERARRLGACVHEIDATEFNHGRTRNLAADLSRGELLVFTTQDAYPESGTWLESLVAPLSSGPEIAGVYGRQLPHHDATPLEQFFLDFLYGPERRVQSIRGEDDVSFETTLFSNVNSAIPRSVWREYRFADDMLMSEDQEWSRRVLLAGRTIVYEPLAPVRHSHAYSLTDAFRRFFDSGASSERAYLGGGRPSRAILRAAARRYATREVAWLWRTGRRRWLPYAAAYELAKFAGLQLGSHHRLLPTRLKRRFSAYPSHW